MSAIANNLEGLDENLIDRDPIRQFKVWLDDAFAAKLPLAEAMSLATVTPDGRPTARMVLLKHVDADGFVFYTNYLSAKARQLEINPYAALVFYWVQLDRQVRVEGKVSKTTTDESSAYFKTRPRESQIGAWASLQSEVISAREVLELRAKELTEQYCDREIDCPEYWGGYRLKPDRIEFWKSRPGRLHDRILYELLPDGTWSIKRLAP